MATLDSIIAAPFRWQDSATNPDLASFLDDLQANILKGHGRHHAGHIFFSFEGMAPEHVAALLNTLGQQVTSALSQLRRNRSLPPYVDGGPVRCLMLSAAGYRKLGRLAALPPGDAFRAGMPARHGVLADPSRDAWNAAGWRSGNLAPDALFLVADESYDAVTRDLEAIEGFINGSGARVIVVERGDQQFRRFEGQAKPAGVEHFGYVDGRSQPLFLEEDIQKEQPHGPTPTGWDPAFAPRQVVVADPNGRHALSAGSYFVFRKLEQDVRGFKAAERALGNFLFPGQPEAVRERAGAMVVGRFENGTPVVLADHEIDQEVPNDFNYAADAAGSRCPFHAHIRKTNPRGEIGTFIPGVPAEANRAPIMARRGITYGQRRMKPDQSDFAEPEGQEPQRDVGLLFMAYMQSIEAQFEFTQQSWADNAEFVRPGTGIDPVIGQGNGSRNYTWPGGRQHAFAAHVRMQGGEYFFAPSRSFLIGVGR